MRRTLPGSMLVALALAGSTGPATACGCGALVSADSAAESRQINEWSLVRFDGRTETILMRLSLGGAALDRVALVLPVPRGGQSRSGAIAPSSV